MGALLEVRGVQHELRDPKSDLHLHYVDGSSFARFDGTVATGVQLTLLHCEYAASMFKHREWCNFLIFQSLFSLRIVTAHFEWKTLGFPSRISYLFISMFLFWGLKSRSTGER